MKTSYVSLATLLLVTATLFLVTSQCTSQQNEREEPELANYMTTMQYHTHKLALSVEANNTELSEFYLHELEEATETVIEDVKTYEGHEIANLMETMFEPSLEPVDEAVESGEWEEAREQMIELVSSCNSCHESTDHGFVVIEPRFDSNPYNQKFEK